MSTYLITPGATNNYVGTLTTNDRLIFTTAARPQDYTVALAPATFSTTSGAVQNYESVSLTQGSTVVNLDLRLASQLSLLGRLNFAGTPDGNLILGVNYTNGTGNSLDTFSNDTLTTSGQDNPNAASVIYGFGGNDTITSGTGADTIDGGVGNDVISSSSGNDSILGGAGTDSILAGGGNDIVFGGTGNDTIIGAAGNDLIYGEDGNDFIRADDSGLSTSDLNTVYGGLGADTIYGGDGNDTLIGNVIGANAADTNDGADLLYGFGGNDLLQGNAGNDTIYAGDGNDTVRAGADNDLIFGDDEGSGNDVLYGDRGADTIVGGGGNDLIVGGNSQTVADPLDGADSLLGGDGNDTIQGNTGNDTIDGGTGNDRLNGGGDNDSIIGGTGNDTILGSEGADTLDGGNGIDVLTGGNGNDSFVFHAGDSLFFSANADTDPVNYDIITDFTTGDLITIDGFLNNGTGNEQVLGATGATFQALSAALIFAEQLYDQNGRDDVIALRVNNDTYLFYNDGLGDGSNLNSIVQLTGVTSNITSANFTTPPVVLPGI